MTADDETVIEKFAREHPDEWARALAEQSPVVVTADPRLEAVAYNIRNARFTWKNGSDHEFDLHLAAAALACVDAQPSPEWLLALVRKGHADYCSANYRHGGSRTHAPFCAAVPTAIRREAGIA